MCHTTCETASPPAFCRAEYKECHWERLIDREAVRLDPGLQGSVGFGLREKSNARVTRSGNGLVRQKAASRAEHLGQESRVHDSSPPVSPAVTSCV